MAEPIKISTSKYTKQGKVEIDGHVWTVKLPGAGTELRMSQLEREQRTCEARLKNLETIIDKGNATDLQIDQYEELSQKSAELSEQSNSIFHQTFNDGTDDNESVKAWLHDTPTAVIYLTFQDVKNGGDSTNEKVNNGSTGPTESS
jgi:hypothetical protein